MSESTVLLIEDELQMRKFVHIALEAQGYRVIDAENGREGLERAATYTPDLVLLDLGLPDTDGLSVMRQLREWTAVPVIVISARELESQKVEALDAGADDYLTKPFGVAELMARVRVALRNAARSAQDPTSSTSSVGDIAIDFAKRLVSVAGQEIHVTPIEYKLLSVMMKHAGKVLTHKQLLDQVWGPGHAHQMQYLRVYMTTLRRKLEKNPARPLHFLTEPGVGYRLKE